MNTWHRHHGHLGTGGMETLTKHQMVLGLDLDPKQQPDFCEPCISGKCHRLAFKQSTNKRASHPLELVYSDVCGKIGTRSLSSGKYLVTFVDNHSHFVWVCILKHKDEVFSWFQEWKAQMERLAGRHLRTDNGRVHLHNQQS